MSDDIKKGLLGIVVDETEVSKVMPEINSLTYRGYAAQDLCAKCKFEEVAYLILNGELPNKKQLKNFENQERRERINKYYSEKYNGGFVPFGSVNSNEKLINDMSLQKIKE